MTTKNFNLEMVKNGAAIQTKLGNPAKFICITRDNKLFVKIYHRSRIVGFSTKYLAGGNSEGTTYKYNLDGKKYSGTTTTDMDLEMVESYKVGPARDAKGRFTKNK